MVTRISTQGEFFNKFYPTSSLETVSKAVFSSTAVPSGEKTQFADRSAALKLPPNPFKTLVGLPSLSFYSFFSFPFFLLATPFLHILILQNLSMSLRTLCHFLMRIPPVSNPAAPPPFTLPPPLPPPTSPSCPSSFLFLSNYPSSLSDRKKRSHISYLPKFFACHFRFSLFFPHP